ncbi:hypothetical protein ACFLTM_00855 [Candidatus Bipolaricaulota bacterium]
MINERVEALKRIGTGLAFIVWPFMAMLAYAVHPNLLSLEIGGTISEKVAQFHNNGLLHFGHFIMLLGVPFLFIIAAKFMGMLKKKGAWWGLIGGVTGCLGALTLAVDKTALCLVPSAFDTLPEVQYTPMIPGLEALFAFEGWLAILWLLPLLAVGFLMLGIGLYVARAIPRWQSVALIVSMLVTAVSSALDIDIVGIAATVILAIAFIPLGIRIMKGEAAPASG